ncbi:hypothetical protein ABR738_15635 [Streptomyces sp. Edi4]|uniref:hypothetical protein n=1 Tax=Streptomyces sp. Edi4 TaxID=3162527 RepID=UPI0033060DF9
MTQPTPPIDHKTTSREVDNATKPLVVKYTTHLPKEMIKWVKREALERDLKDYEIMQQALREFQFKDALTR